ncbi:MAG: sulfur carrier protein ThiS [Vulcanococcus sp.]|jgi:sulfur carrier protein|uniref:sulfur carrier protein ThiS n=1 Tax=Vulcanococcus sp. TaxID=2856995 RepID=UPI0025EED1F6|nr:sulfur carrier protein ThiS [Vulcanococcus sp.]MBW0165986.1 sulfur carrier protein ThiS [Vulcanococcus sp.]
MSESSTSTIEVRLNGDPMACPEGLSLLQLLELRGYKPQLVVVEFNGEILPRASWADQPVREADAVEVVTIVGGGS